jgi:transposase-like protein
VGRTLALRGGMDWPEIPVERHRPFQPPHCPWEACPSHRRGAEFAWHRHGRFTRRGDGRRVPRFRCRVCRRTFSVQTFSCSYYLKRAELSEPVAAGLVAGSANRQLGRSLGCAPSTVTRRSARLGRHALLLLERCHESLGGLREPVVYDDFEGFAHSQEEAAAVGTAVGQDSWFVYGIEIAPHPRVGRRSPAQQARLREAPVRPGARTARVASFTHTVDRLRRLAGARLLRLVTDGHDAYRRGLSRHPHRHRVEHAAFPNPKRGPKGSPRSREARVRDRQMFPVDLLHSLIRHSAAHHRRETIAFARRHNALAERAFLLAAWRNFVKSVTERRSGAPTPAMRLGLTDRAWSWGRVLAQRLFPWRLRLSDSWRAIYRRQILTPSIGVNAPHALVNAA